jgi:hypothetical protein
VKDYYEKKNVRELFNHIKKDPKGDYVYVNHSRRDGVMCNLNDGVIFTPCKMPYVVKNCSALLKWKPPHLNSIDFALQLERAVDPRSDTPTVRTYIAYRSENGNSRLREVYFPSKLKRTWAEAFEEYNNCIVELSYDRGGGEWRFIRRRDDKDVPNFSGTVIDTMESIAESMDREELTAYIERKTAPVPADAEEIVQQQEASRAVCTFANDLFDEENLAYLTTTPISRVPPPHAAPFSGHGGRTNGRAAERRVSGGRPHGGGHSGHYDDAAGPGADRGSETKSKSSVPDAPVAYVDV